MFFSCHSHLLFGLHTEREERKGRGSKGRTEKETEREM